MLKYDACDPGDDNKECDAPHESCTMCCGSYVTRFLSDTFLVMEEDVQTRTMIQTLSFSFIHLRKLLIYAIL